MSGELSFDVEQRLPVVVVRPRGVLDAYTAADLRAVLLACLAEQPTGVVIDTSELSVADDIGLTVLVSVAQQSERWPGTRFAMSARTAEFAAAAERMGVARSVSVCADMEAALKEANQWPVPPSARQRIDPDRNAPSVARAAVHDFCQAQRVGGDGDAAQLVASELVTNAVVHARTLIDLTLRLIPPHLHIAVRDCGDGQARIGGIIDESSETGRGLLLVDALATAWGTFVPDVGKVVWATVRVKPVDRSP
jgi:anti-anti-sigma factor